MERREDLVARAQAGDAEAYSALAQAVYPSLMRLARALPANGCEPADLVQDALVTAYVHLGALRNGAAFDGWARSVLRRLALRRARGPQADLFGSEPPDDLFEPAPSAFAQAEAQEGMGALAGQVRALPEPARTSAVLFYLHGLSISQVAEVQAVPPGTVKRRLHDARRLLHQEVDGMEHSEKRDRWEASEALALGFPRGDLTSALGDGVETLILSTARAEELPGSDGLVAMSFSREMAGGVQPSPWERPVIASVYDSMAALLRDAGVALEGVLLDTAAQNRARATARLRLGGDSADVAVPVALALALAQRLGAAIHATPALMAAATVGGDIGPQLARKSVSDLKVELQLSHRWNAMVSLAWDSGLSPERGIDCFRIAPDEASGTLGIYVGDDEEPSATLPLDRNRDLWEFTRRQRTTESSYNRHYRNDGHYSYTSVASDGAMVLTFAPVRD